MTPDMQRLCEAAESGFYDVTDRAHGLFEHEAQAVVRAILTALRKPSLGMIEAACSLGAPGEHPSAEEELVAMIDHILAEPTPA